MPGRKQRDNKPPKPTSDEERQSAYSRTSSTFKNLMTILGVIVTVLAVLGYVFTFGQEADRVHDALDRNCRFLAIIEADDRYLIVEHTQSHATAQAFRAIFQNSIRDTCG